MSSTPSIEKSTLLTTSEVTPQQQTPDDNDLDPAAFLKSVRELSEKREREDNERFRKLEEEVAKGRQERLARRAEYARSISPEKHIGTPTITSRAAASTRSSADVYTSSPPPSTRSSNSIMSDQKQSVSSRSSAVEDVPEFTGFGAMRKTSDPASTNRQSSTPTMSTNASPTPAARASPSAAMPSRTGTVKWQQRPQSRGGASRPLSVVAAENSANVLAQTRAETSPERSRDDIASALSAKDPSWFRQTADRGIGNAAFRKDPDETTSSGSGSSSRHGLPGMATTSDDVRPTSQASSSAFGQDLGRATSTNGNPVAQDRSQTEEGNQPKHLTSLGSDRTNTISSSASNAGLMQARLNRGLSRSPSPTKEMGGFVQSALLKRSDSINKRSTNQINSAATRSGYGGLQGSHSMPRLEQPPTSIISTDSLMRTASSADITKPDVYGKETGENGSTHARHRSITSAYTTNGNETTISTPSSPSRRWSPNKSSWIESALTTKQEARPPSPAKNSQPAWMANLAKAKLERNQPAGQSREEAMVRSSEGAQQSIENNSSQSEDANGLGIDLISPVKRVESAPQAAASSTENVPSVAATFKRVESAPQTAADVTDRFLDSARDVDAKLTMDQSAAIAITRPKPTISPKPQMDFRSTLRSRAPAAAKPQEQPEFLARIGSLRKATTEKFVAPDVLKDNILRGKAGLAVTDGPQKSERRDELKDSLVAKKDEWRREKDAGIVHEHKTRTPPVTPKPEALAQREILGRGGSIKAGASPEKGKAPTPEALRRHQSIRSKPVVGESKSKDAQFSVKGADKLASFMAPNLANMIARGPQTSGKAQPDKPDDVEKPVTRPSSEPAQAARPLQDMRKGRAKGPKRRKAGSEAPNAENQVEEREDEQTEPSLVISAVPVSPKPLSTASLMMASLGEQAERTPPVTPPTKPSGRSWPLATPEPLATQSANLTPQLSSSPSKDVPAFAGFGKQNKNKTRGRSENKENRASDLSFLPSVRNSTTSWETSTTKSTERPLPIQLPSRKDEEAAMRSAGLLASASPSLIGLADRQSGSRSAIPPKPTKSSRIVSGQLQEASPNKEIPVKPPDPEAYRALMNMFGSIPQQITQHGVDMPNVGSVVESLDVRRTLRREVHELDETTNARLNKLCGVDEYIFFNQAVVIVQHVYMTTGGSQFTAIYVWKGTKASDTDGHSALQQAKSMARGSRPAVVLSVQQGRESSAFLQAVGGILVCRRGLRREKTGDYLLCGRRYLSHIVLDEVDLEPKSFCAAYVYLLVRADSDMLYLWKGSACATEELCAGRLVATDIARNGQFVEISDGNESRQFLSAVGGSSSRKTFERHASLLRRKAEMPNEFNARLYRLQAADCKPSLLSSIFTRRPSWSTQTSLPDDVPPKLNVQEIKPFLQDDLEADGLYMLDGFAQTYLLLGPLFQDVTSEVSRRAVFTQALQFCEDYARLCSSHARRVSPSIAVVLGGVPVGIRHLFRNWDEDRGLWGTAGLMSGSHHGGSKVSSIELDALLNVIRWSDQDEML